MYLLGDIGEFNYQSELWKLRSTGRLTLHDLTTGEIDRMAILMEKYKDLPMDLADASLVAAADSLQLDAIFSLDGDFRVYRLANGKCLRLYIDE